MDKSSFQKKEWAALRYAHEWTRLSGNDPEGDIMEEYQLMYSKKERARINKLMRVMLFSNYFSNVCFRKEWRKTSDINDTSVAAMKKETTPL